MLAAGVAGADACGPEGAEIRGADAAKADAPLVDAPARLAADTDTTRRAGPPAPGAQGRASAAEYEGWRQYAVNCARCHGDDAVGGVMAPDLRASVARGSVDSASFHQTVSRGRREKGMPAFEGVLRDEQIAAIYAYVAARAKGKLPAGRPRR